MSYLRFTVTNKIVVGLSVILLIGMLSMLIIYNGLDAVAKNIQQLADLEEPAVAAAAEMEINVNESGVAVLHYLDSHDPRYRAWVEKDQIDFEKFHAKYLRLANTSEERQLGKTIGTLYLKFKRLGETLMNRADDQEAFFTTMISNAEKIDNIVGQLPSVMNRRGSDALVKIETVLDMEAEIADMAFWVANYQRVQKEEYKRQIIDERGDFQRALTRFQNLDLSPEERDPSQSLQEMFNETNVLAGKVVALEDHQQENIERYIDLRIRMDRVLDEEIQVIALQHLYAPSIEADQAMEETLRAIRYMIPLYVLAAIAVGGLLIRVINRPLTRLMRGTDAIGRGNLNHRIDLRGGDEFTDLANHFNGMVEQLQAIGRASWHGPCSTAIHASHNP
jgi:HAMP domain-containing protein